MKRRLFCFSIFSLFLSALMPGFSSGDCACDHNVYVRLASGASFPLDANIDAPSEFWDPAIEGYDGHLKTRPILEIAGGYDFCPWISADLSLSFRPKHSYRKFQTPKFPDVPGTLGNKRRRFKLDLASLMFSLYFSGRGMEWLSWDLGCGWGEIYPYIGAGVGGSRLVIYDFRSTGLPPVDLQVRPFDTFAGDNAYTVRYQLTYQAMAGLEYRWCNLALFLGYRWFDARCFKGPRYIRERDGQSTDVGKFAWKMRHRANELSVGLKFYL